MVQTSKFLLYQDSPCTNATLVEMVPFSMYALCVQASTRIGYGYFTSPVIITTDPDSPYPPANFTASVLSSTSIRLSWGYPLIPRSLVAGYQIIHNVSLFPNPVNIIIASNDTSQHTYTFLGLSPYTVYFFSVRAFSYLSRSNLSTVINGSYTQQIINSTLQDGAIHICSKTCNISIFSPDSSFDAAKLPALISVIKYYYGYLDTSIPT